MDEESKRGLVLSCSEIGSNESVVDEFRLPSRSDQCVAGKENGVNLLNLV